MKTVLLWDKLWCTIDPWMSLSPLTIVALLLKLPKLANLIWKIHVTLSALHTESDRSLLVLIIWCNLEQNKVSLSLSTMNGASGSPSQHITTASAWINEGGVEASLCCVTITKSLWNVTSVVSPLRHHTTPPFNTSADFNREASLARRKSFGSGVCELTNESRPGIQTVELKQPFWTAWENWCVCNPVLVMTQNKKSKWA